MSMSFHTRLTIYIVTAVTVFFLAIFYYNFVTAQRTIYKLSFDKANTLSMATVEKIENVLNSVEQVPIYLAQQLEMNDLSIEELDNILRNFIASTPNVYGCAIAFAPGVLEDGPKLFSPYYYKKNNSIDMRYLNTNKYKYWERAWFTEPQKTKSSMWSEPYFDAGGGNILMTTFSVPIYRKDNQGKEYFYAVVTADVTIDWLQNMVGKIEIYETGHAFIISKNGLFVVHRNDNFIMNSSIYTLAKENNNAKLQELAKNMTQGKRGATSLISIETGKEVEVIYAPLPSTNWSLALFIPIKELFEELYEQSYIIVMLALIGICGISVLISVVAYKSTVPLRQLSKSTEEIAKGNLDIHLPHIQHMDEIGKLTSSFDNMRNALKEYIINLTHTVATRERIESELKIARIIQADFLPKNFPPFPQYKEFDIYASLIPAREVGGDLYDFFFINEKQLFFSIGDVSDKGIPAALFMAITKTLIKSTAEYEHNPAKVLEKVNNELSLDNESNMFVTVFCGVLDIYSGELIYTNAGHNAPLLLRAGQEVQELPLPQSLVLGAMPEVSYTNTTMKLCPHDKLLLYTDGITEAMNIHNNIFGLEALKVLIHKNTDKPLESILKNIGTAIDEHATGAEQSDDMTLMAIQWFGS